MGELGVTSRDKEIRREREASLSRGVFGNDFYAFLGMIRLIETYKINEW
jgi:hypothetical protein